MILFGDALSKVLGAEDDFRGDLCIVLEVMKSGNEQFTYRLSKSFRGKPEWTVSSPLSFNVGDMIGFEKDWTPEEVEKEMAVRRVVG